MDYHLKIEEELNIDQIERIYSSVFRKDYEEYGFIVISFDMEMNSKLLRKYMFEIKKVLSEKCREEFDERLDFYWLGRFNQQNTTKYHRDNAPKDSYLMLGYEPTEIDSKLSFGDYNQLITKNKIPIDKYYELHNPIFKDGEELLKPFISQVKNFDNRTYKIVLMNNSDLSSKKTYGILHKAEIIEKDLDQPRVINSMMLYMKPMNEPNYKTKEEEIEFLETDKISK